VRLQARRIGLVHDVVPLAELEAAGASIVASFLENGPLAIAAEGLASFVEKHPAR
jgi:enoyl-CoA hydratase/carnithine racemase